LQETTLYCPVKKKEIFFLALQKEPEPGYASKQIPHQYRHNRLSAEYFWRDDP